MRLNPFQRILGFLTLFAAVHKVIASINAECTVQAWVRAPDLAPNTIVQGDARVKISAGCPAVEAVLLGLRLKERSFVKVLRSGEDRKRVNSTHPRSMNPREGSPWAYPPSRFDNRSDEVAFYEVLANMDLWMIREEERVVFETTQLIHMVEGAPGDHDVVQDFAVLVPSTNFPPAQDYLNSGFMLGGGGDIEIADVESVNEYFVRVSFANGTIEDISAGFTGFEPLYDPTDTPRRPSSDTIGLKVRSFGPPGEDSPITNYTAQISTVSGLIFTEGSEDQVVTVVISRTGPARTFSAPLTVRGCVAPTFSSKWALEHDMAVSRPWHRPEYVLRSTLEDVEEAKHNSWKPPCSGPPGAGVSITMPNSTTDEIQSHDIVTTTSAAITIPVKVDRRQITNFDAYYQTLANSLQITLGTPRTEGEIVDPDDPSVKPPSTWDPVFEDDEEDWVPWEKKTSNMPQPSAWRTYSGSVPVVVHPVGEVAPSQGCLHASTDMSGQVVLSDERGCERPSLTHYLDEGARGPTFVDRSAIHELLAQDPAERELRAPILEPVVSSPPEGEELIFRYYRRLNPHKPLIYVGETWAKKGGQQRPTRGSPSVHHRVSYFEAPVVVPLDFY